MMYLFGFKHQLIMNGNLHLEVKDGEGKKDRRKDRTRSFS